MPNSIWHLIIGSFFLLCSASVNAIPLTDLQQMLSAHTVTQGEFTQTRHLDMLDVPLISHGQFVLSQNDGLLWQQNTPFPLSLVLTDSTLKQKMPGQPINVVNADDNPMVFYFSSLFLSLFQGDTDALEDQFSLTLSGTTEQWTLTLIPKEPPLTHVFSEITLLGNQNITTLSLREVRGDNSTIVFSNITHAMLTEEERREFSQ